MKYLILNTKGGTGKSTFSTQILPLILNDNILVLEADNNNKTILNNSFIQIKNLFASDDENLISELIFNDENDILIDAGGGDDSRKVVEILAKNEVDIDYFFIPISNDFETVKNLIDTVNLIKSNFKEPKIILVLNKVNNLNKLQEEFLFIFGKQELGIKNLLKTDLKDTFKNVVVIPQNNLISYIKNAFGQTLKDFLKSLKELEQIPLSELQKKWVTVCRENFKKEEEQKECFKKKYQNYKLFREIKEFADFVGEQLKFLRKEEN